MRFPDSKPVPGVFDVLVIDVELKDGTDTNRWAYVGPHCGSVFMFDDYVAVETKAYAALNGSRALLVVNGTAKGNWTTMGGEPYGLALPATVRVQVGDQDVHVANVTWNATKQRAWIDGMQVTLPDSWTSSARDGTWRIQASLQQVTTKVEVWERQGACH